MPKAINGFSTYLLPTYHPRLLVKTPQRIIRAILDIKPFNQLKLILIADINTGYNLKIH